MALIGQVDLGSFPILLAPMEDITDPPFRRLCRLMGADLVYSEFISSEGLIREAGSSVQKMDVLPEERPVALQIVGHDVNSMVRAAKMVEQAQPDFIDLNFGCPVRKVVNKGSGAALLKDIPALLHIAREVVKATHIPVTAKTRLGWDEKNICIVELAEQLQDAGIQALAVHARTARQMYSGQANWSWFDKIKANPRLSIPLFGNGDINSPERAIECRNQYPVDGIMIGRAAVGNPWLFRDIKAALENKAVPEQPALEERVQVCTKHLLDSVAWKGERVAIYEMRKHYGKYFKGLPGFKVHKMRLVSETNLGNILNILGDLHKIT
jgi:nifR3 family TIM-barrel protein